MEWITNILQSSISVISVQFLIFIAVSTIIYYVIPKKGQWIFLLVASTFFYICGGLNTIMFLIFSTIVAYIFANIISGSFDKQKRMIKKIKRMKKDPNAEKENIPDTKQVKKEFAKKRKIFFVISLVLIILVLFITKYLGFAFKNINAVISLFSAWKIDYNGIVDNIPTVLGCSYFTLSLISYLTDVYRNRYESEHNFFKLYLFVSYFPHIIQGPIERYDYLMPQLMTHHKFDFDRIKRGLMLIVWGFFKKYVFADRLNTATSQIFSNYTQYNGVMVLFGAALFSIQLYADWTAYCDIVGGASEMLGVSITKNFERPYFSRTMPEFWRRWHISMGKFFKDYVLYPISAARFSLNLSKTARKKYGNNAGKIIASIIPIIAVWMLTGLWHGSSWNFILWGFYQGLLILLSISFENPIKEFCQKLHWNTETKFWRVFGIFRTFFLCCIGRLLFKATSLADVLGLFGRLPVITTTMRFRSLGLSDAEWIIIAISACLMLLYSLLEEKYHSVERLLNNSFIVIRWVIFILMIIAILVFGVYGAQAGYTAFVYADF